VIGRARRKDSGLRKLGTAINKSCVSVMKTIGRKFGRILYLPGTRSSVF
jgi:hypothetical protein